MAELQIDLEVEGTYRPDPRGSFGFVTPTDGSVTDRVLVGTTCVKKSGHKSLPDGARVKCFCVRKEKGLRAKRIKVLS